MKINEKKIHIPKVTVRDNKALYKYRKQPDVFQGDFHHRIMVALGGIGSGKTTAIIEFMLMMLTTHSYDKIFWVSPTINDDCGKKDNIPPDVLEIVEDYDDKWLLKTMDYMRSSIREYKVYLEYKAIWDRCVLGNHKPTFREYNILESHDWNEPHTDFKHGFPCFLMLIDDSVADKRIFSSTMRGLMPKFFTVCRHFSCSIILSTQVFKNGVPSCLRGGMIGSWLIFHASSDKLKKMIGEEIASKIKPEVFSEIWEHACRKQYDFLYIDYATWDETKRFRRKWDTFLNFDATLGCEASKDVEKNKISQNNSPENNPK